MGWISKTQQQRDHSNKRNVCAACGHPATAINPLVVANDGMRVHQTHITDRNSGYYGKSQ